MIVLCGLTTATSESPQPRFPPSATLCGVLLVGLAVAGATTLAGLVTSFPWSLLAGAVMVRILYKTLTVAAQATSNPTGNPDDN
jgi:hypothetical protein